MAVTTRGWPLVDTTTAEDRCRTCAVACAAGAFLAVDLLGRIADLGPCLDLVRTLLRVVTLPADDTVQNVGAWFKTEQGLVQVYRTGCAAVELDDIKFHSSPSFLVSSKVSL